jgi:hypothetical protein
MYPELALNRSELRLFRKLQCRIGGAQHTERLPANLAGKVNEMDHPLRFTPGGVSGLPQRVSLPYRYN